MSFAAPRLPVLDWDTFSGIKSSSLPCVLEHPTTHFTVSGRAAILLALEMLKIGPGDKVLVPTYHCPTMIAPIVALGSQAIFYPINSNGAPDLIWLKHNFNKDIRVILVAHFFGLPQPLADIRRWCDQQGVRLVEDCAHALFGVSGDRAVGLWGDISIASLTKFLPVPEGGCLVDNMSQGSIPLLRPPTLKSQLKSVFDIIHVSVNHGRLTGLGPFIQVASGLRRLFKPKPVFQEPAGTSDDDTTAIDFTRSHLNLTTSSRWIARYVPQERIVSRRRMNFKFLTEELSGLAGLRPLMEDLQDNCAPYVFPLWVDQPDPSYTELRRLNFPVSRWDQLWPKVTTIEDDIGLIWSHHVLQLACHQDLTSAELQWMVTTIKRLYASPCNRS